MAIDNFRVENEEQNEEPSVVYVKFMGKDIDGTYIYHFYLSTNPEEVFAEGWGEVPACTVPRKLMDIDKEMYEYVVELKSGIKLDLAQDCGCFSMQDSRDHIVALAFENLDNAEEYPDPRIIIQFGDGIDYVEEMFAKRDISLKYID